MARRMKTSRAALDRFLAPGNASVTLQTLSKAARAIGRDLRMSSSDDHGIKVPGGIQYGACIDPADQTTCSDAPN